MAQKQILVNISKERMHFTIWLIGRKDGGGAGPSGQTRIILRYNSSQALVVTVFCGAQNHQNLTAALLQNNSCPDLSRVRVPIQSISDGQNCSTNPVKCWWTSSIGRARR